MLATASRSLGHLGTFTRTAARSLGSLSWHAEDCHRSPETREEAQTELVPFSIHYEAMKMISTHRFTLPRKDITLRAIQEEAYNNLWVENTATETKPHGSPSQSFFVKDGKWVQTDQQLRTFEPASEPYGNEVSVALRVFYKTPRQHLKPEDFL